MKPAQHHAVCPTTEAASASETETRMRYLRMFLRNQSGAAALEYGLVAAGIPVAIIAVVNSLGTQLKTTFSTVTANLSNAGL